MDEATRPRIVFVELTQLLRLYALVIGCPLDVIRDYVRDRGGLESAVARPLNYVVYRDERDLAFLAAVLAHGIAEGQYFIDGNKRTALVALDLFLRLNGHSLRASQQERADWMIHLSGDWTVDQLAAAIRAALTHS